MGTEEPQESKGFAYPKNSQGPSNERVWTCIAGVRVLKITIFEGSGFLGICWILPPSWLSGEIWLGIFESSKISLRFHWGKYRTTRKSLQIKITGLGKRWFPKSRIDLNDFQLPSQKYPTTKRKLWTVAFLFRKKNWQTFRCLFVRRLKVRKITPFCGRFFGRFWSQALHPSTVLALPKAVGFIAMGYETRLETGRWLIRKWSLPFPKSG